MSGAIQNFGDLAATQSTASSAMNRFARKYTGQTADKAADDFEGMFMSQMLQPMFDTVGVDPIFGGGHGEEMMRGFLVQEYGKALSQSSHFGIADAVRGELEKTQQKVNAKASTLTYGAAYAAGQTQ